MHVKCDNHYKTGADGENILGLPMLFVCMGIMTGYLVYVLIVKSFSH